MGYPDSKPKTKITTSQMEKAPEGAFYIWLNSDLIYPKTLAHTLNRCDLKIRPISWLTIDHIMAYNRNMLIIDHACKLSKRQIDLLDRIRNHENTENRNL